MSDGSTKVVIGSYESGATHVLIPSQAVERASRALDAERERRRRQTADDVHARLKRARASRKFQKAIAQLWRSK